MSLSSDIYLDLPGLQHYDTKIKEFIASSGAYDTSPIGAVVSYLGLNAPNNWLICDGTEYNIYDYPKLAEFIKNQYGRVNYFGGDGETTFSVPDLRDRFILGAGESRSVGMTGGSENISLTVDEMPAHTHGTASITVEETGNGGSLFSGGDDELNVSATSETGSTGGGQPFSILPPYYTLLYIIKAKVSISLASSNALTLDEIQNLLKD